MKVKKEGCRRLDKVLEVKKECKEDEERKREEIKHKTRGRDRGVFELDFLA